MRKPSVVRFALACGAMVRVTIVVERAACRCTGKHRPSARRIAGDVWMALQDEDTRAAEQRAEGGEHA
jgi:hypothetical protein